MDTSEFKTASQFRSWLFERLRALDMDVEADFDVFWKDEVESAVAEHCARVDIAVKPLAEHVELKLIHESALANPLARYLLSVTSDPVNDRPHCLVAVELSFSASSKRMMGAIVNASLSGYVGLVLTPGRTSCSRVQMLQYHLLSAQPTSGTAFRVGANIVVMDVPGVCAVLDMIQADEQQAERFLQEIRLQGFRKAHPHLFPRYSYEPLRDKYDGKFEEASESDCAEAEANIYSARAYLKLAKKAIRDPSKPPSESAFGYLLDSIMASTTAQLLIRGKKPVVGCSNEFMLGYFLERIQCRPADADLTLLVCILAAASSEWCRPADADLTKLEEFEPNLLDLVPLREPEWGPNELFGDNEPNAGELYGLAKKLCGAAAAAYGSKIRRSGESRG